jgi:hypothetical protein
MLNLRGKVRAKFKNCWATFQKKHLVTLAWHKMAKYITYDDVGLSISPRDEILRQKISHLLKLPSPAAATSMCCFHACVNTALLANIFRLGEGEPISQY